MIISGIEFSRIDTIEAGYPSAECGPSNHLAPSSETVAASAISILDADRRV